MIQFRGKSVDANHELGLVFFCRVVFDVGQLDVAESVRVEETVPVACSWRFDGLKVPVTQEGRLKSCVPMDPVYPLMLVATTVSVRVWPSGRFSEDRDRVQVKSRTVNVACVV